MEEFLFTLQQQWVLRALLASSLVGLMCGALGCFIVLRNMALIGDALAHAILPGVVFAFVIVGYSQLGFFTGSVLAGLLAAAGITWIQRNVKTKNDSAIGIVFTAMFSIGVMGISKISRDDGVHLDLKDFLFGNALGVSNEDLILTALIALYVFASILVFYRQLFVSTFQPIIAQTMGISVSTIHYFLMLMLSFVVVASLRTVGVILVVAMLITPASTALLLTNRLPRVILISSLLGLLSAVIGLIFTIQLDTTPGPAMVIVATLFYAIAVFFAPEKGMAFRYWHKRRLRQRIQLEDILKQASKLQQKGSLSMKTLADKVEFSKFTLQRHLSSLRKKGFVAAGDKLALTTSGRDEAKRLTRAHRLWETYLVNTIGLTPEQIHEDAEKYEHLLTEEILDDVDAELGYPMVDPHGSPIPKKRGQVELALAMLSANEQGIIADYQVNDHVIADLWEKGLLPGSEFGVLRQEKERIVLQFQGKEVAVETALARNINVKKQVAEKK